MKALKHFFGKATLDFYVVVFVDASAFMKLDSASAAVTVIVVTCAWFWLRWALSNERYHEEMMNDEWGKGK